MAKCISWEFVTELDVKPDDPCNNTGWPELDNLCPQHFSEYKLRPASDEAFAAIRKHFTLLTRLNNVEVAMGLRAAPAPAGRKAIRDLAVRVPKTTTAHITKDDFDDLE